MLQFVPGGVYRNRRGEYEVLEVKTDKLRVRYDDGEEAELSAESQRRIAENMAREADALAPSTDSSVNHNFFKTVGYLSSGQVLIEGFAPPNAVEGFQQTYLSLTGRKLGSEQSFYAHPEGTDKWGVELRVEFPRPGGSVPLEFGFANARAVSSPKGSEYLRVNSNQLVRHLFRLGFVFGTQQDINRIRDRIPPTYVSDFDRGIM